MDCDPKQVPHVLTNLLFNVLTFTPPCGTIEVYAINESIEGTSSSTINELEKKFNWFILNGLVFMTI
jgi:signal transduction histidine kinase